MLSRLTEVERTVLETSEKVDDLDLLVRQLVRTRRDKSDRPACDKEQRCAAERATRVAREVAYDTRRQQ